ncbi:replication initiation protein, partial [Escherichia coli]|nr:replication initiation protein [Escherichia coli]
MRKAQAEATSREEEAREAEMDRARRLRAGRLGRIRELVAARTPTQRDADKRLFLARLDDDVEREEFMRLGWGSALSV